jgi:antitoxin ChpS
LLPKALLDWLRLKASANAVAPVEHGHLALEANPKPKYALAGLLAPCDPTAPSSPDEKEWEEAPRTGRELL